MVSRSRHSRSLGGARVHRSVFPRKCDSASFVLKTWQPFSSRWQLDRQVTRVVAINTEFISNNKLSFNNIILKSLCFSIIYSTLWTISPLFMWFNSVICLSAFLCCTEKRSVKLYFNTKLYERSIYVCYFIHVATYFIYMPALRLKSFCQVSIQSLFWLIQFY